MLKGNKQGKRAANIIKIKNIGVTGLNMREKKQIFR
jgi:hypothetical protein